MTDAGVGYTLTKWIHVTLAIVAVGFNLSYAIWIRRAAREPAGTQLWVLQGIHFIDGRFASPAYGLLLLTGLLMAFTAGYPLTTLWIAGALGLYALAIVLGIGLMAPNYRAQVRALEGEGPQSLAYRAEASRGRLLGIIGTLDVLAIVFLMVVKPTL